jgi:transposase
MAQTTQSRGIPTQLSQPQVQQFVLPHLTVGRRGPAPKLSLHAVFNYILKSLYMGCQWKALPITKDAVGHPEIQHSRIHGAFRR